MINDDGRIESEMSRLEANQMTHKRDRIESILNNYNPATDFCKFSFKWNKKHGEGLRDTNHEFRTRLINRVLQSEQKKQPPWLLIKDLFLEHSKLCKKSWGASSDYTRLSELYFRECNGRSFKEYLFALDSSMDTWYGGLNFTLSKGEFEPIAEKIRETIHKMDDVAMRKALLKGLKMIEDTVVKTVE